MSTKNKLRCKDCGAVFQSGDEIYIWENDLLCGQCFDWRCRELSRRERAAAMDCGVEICE